MEPKLEHYESDENLLAEIRALGVDRAELFSPEILNFSQDIREMCVMNTCGAYGNNWACPPATGTVEELKTLCLGYQKGILFNVIAKLVDSFDWEGMMDGARRHKELTDAAAGIFRESGVSRHKVFGGGGCKTCEKCTYPDAPCRFPDQLYLPIEGCGTNVSQLAKEVGMNYINGQNTVTYFGMILYDD